MASRSSFISFSSLIDLAFACEKGVSYDSVDGRECSEKDEKVVHQFSHPLSFLEGMVIFSAHEVAIRKDAPCPAPAK